MSALSILAVGCGVVSEVSESTYGVFVKEVVHENDVVTVHLCRSGEGESLGDSIIAITEEDGEFFDSYIYSLTFDGGAIFSAVRDRLTQDGTISGENEDSSLKIVYDYDTIYKSIKSDGTVSKEGGVYSHHFQVNEGMFQVTLTREIPNQSSWYAVLIGVTVALLGVAVGIFAVRGKRNGRKTQEN